MAIGVESAAPDKANATKVVLIGVVAAFLGFALAAVWSYELVDDVIGNGIATFLLGEDAAASAGLFGSIAMATVTGLAGTFTACNVACFASMGPLAAQASERPASRGQLLGRATGQLVWLALGMAAMAGLYGAAIVAAGDSAPMLRDDEIAGLPARLVQASVVNVVLGLGLLAVGIWYLRGRALPGGRYGTLALGGLLGLLIVGRPFPMFRDVLADAAAEGNILRGSLMMLLVVAGNLVLLSILLLGTIALAGPAIQRFTSRKPRAILMVGGALLVALAVFSLAYWGWRVPALVGSGWFPEI